MRKRNSRPGDAVFVPLAGPIGARSRRPAGRPLPRDDGAAGPVRLLALLVIGGAACLGVLSPGVARAGLEPQKTPEQFEREREPRLARLHELKKTMEEAQRRVDELRSPPEGASSSDQKTLLEAEVALHQAQVVFFEEGLADLKLREEFWGEQHPFRGWSEQALSIARMMLENRRAALDELGSVSEGEAETGIPAPKPEKREPVPEKQAPPARDTVPVRAKPDPALPAAGPVSEADRSARDWSAGSSSKSQALSRDLYEAWVESGKTLGMGPPPDASGYPGVSAGGSEEEDPEGGLARAGASVGTALGNVGSDPFQARGALEAGRMPGGAGAEGKPRARSPGESRFGSTADSSSMQKLLLASMTGFQGSFRREGLRVGPGPDGRRTILRVRDGKPAAASDLDGLRARIASEPEVLRKRPDFFRVLPRDRFDAVKRSYRSDPEARENEFKHIGMSGGYRDFRWTESCAKVSGDCNESARESSYKKNGFVSPETLFDIAAMMRAAKRRAADKAGKGAAKMSKRRSRGLPVILAAALRSGAGRLFSWVRGGIAPAAGAASRPGRPAGIKSVAVPPPRGTGRSPDARPGQGGGSRPEGGRRRRLPLVLFCGAGAAGLLWLGLRRKSSG